MKEKYICELGPGSEYPGGILAVIDDYMNSHYLNKFFLKHIVTVSKRHKILGFLKGMKDYLELCFLGRVSLAHIHMSERGSCTRAIVFILISQFFNIPVIVHSHGSEIIEYYNGLSKIRKRIFNNTMNKASKVIILTPGWGNFWKKIVKKEKLVVIPNYVKIPQNMIKKYMLNNRLNILFIGYIGYRKGTFDLLKALDYLIRRMNELNVHLTIAGNGEVEKCKALVLKYGLEKYIDILGWVDSKKRNSLLKESDVLVLPSHFESFGIVALEAMSYKLAVICGDAGFTKEIVKNGETGYVVETGNYKDIAIKLDSVIPNLERFGENGYDEVKKNYSEEVIMKKVKHIYEEVIKNG